MSNKWNDFQPSKTTWFWSCVGAVVVTMVVGFTVGGWVTGGTASQMADSARDQGRMQLAADVCVAKFRSSEGYATALASLKKENSWSRDDFVSAGGWVTLTGMDDPVTGAARLCADTLAKMDAPAAAAAPTAPDAKTSG